MTVKKLIQALQGLPEDMQVMLSQPSGCYWRRTLAGEISEIQHATIAPSAYYNQALVVENPEDADDPNDDEDPLQEVILLS